MADNLVTVINPDNKQPMQIKADDLSSAIGDGAIYVPHISKADLDEHGNVSIINPDDHKPMAVPVDKVYSALADGGRLASTWNPNKIQTYADMIQKDSDQLKNYTSLDKIQDADGKYIVKDVSSGQEFHLPQDQALKLVGSNFMQFADPEFQAMVDAHRQNAGPGKAIGAGFKGIAAGTPVIGALVNKLSSFLTKDTPYIPGKASDIASALNTATPGTGEAKAHNLGETAGTVSSIVGAIAQPELGLMGEGLAATKLATGATRLAEAAELSPLAMKVMQGAGQGLGYSLPYVADQVINQQPGKAAETALLSMGIGSLLHVAPSAINAALSKRGAEAAAELPNAAQGILTDTGLNPNVMVAGEKAPFVKELLTQAPHLQNVEQGLKNIVAGEHMGDVLTKLNQKIDTVPLINKLEELGYHTGVSSEANEQLGSILKSIQKASSGDQVALSELQKINKSLVDGINYKAAVGDVASMKLVAIDGINNTILKAGDEALIKAIDAGDSKAAKLADAWQTAKENQQIAQSLLGEFQQKVGAGVAPELTQVGKLVKNVFSQTGAGVQAKLQNPGAALLNLVPGVRTLTKAPGELAAATSDVVKARATGFDAWIAEHPNSFLTKNIDNPKIATFVALDSIASSNAKLAEIPQFLKTLGSKAPGIFATQGDPIAKILGSEATGLTKDQQLQRLSDKVSFLAGNPLAAQNQINNLVKPFATDHPEMTAAAQQLAMNKIQYLNQILHANNTQAPVAFQVQPSNKMSPAQLANLKSQLAVIENPYALLSGISNGTVTKSQVQAVAMTSPAILDEIRQTINKEAYNGKAKLNYQQRISASMIMGQALDPSLNKVAQIQSSFAPPAPSSPPPGNTKGGSSGKGKTGHKLSQDKMPTHQTMAQRISQ